MSIKWTLEIERNNAVEAFRVAQNETVQVNETDFIRILIDIPSDFFDSGNPYLVLGDVPYDLEIIKSSNTTRRFGTAISSKAYENQLFYNYFGESEVKLFFDGNEEAVSVLNVDIKARPANAEMAVDMLNFLSSNVDDVLLLCFSKSRKSGGTGRGDSDSITKLSILKDTLDYIYENQGTLLRDYRFKWSTEISLTGHGQPSGPDSVKYVLNNLDKITHSTPSEANIRFNNRSYKVENIPKESLNQDADVFENRVVFSFLHSAKDFLYKVRASSIKSNTPPKKRLLGYEESSNFVSFDNVLGSYKEKIINHHIRDIDFQIVKVNKLISLFGSKIGAKFIPNLMPRITQFIASRPTYISLFRGIHRWYLCNAPNISDNSFLFGLRNLSTIYELCCLLVLNKSIEDAFKVNLSSSEYLDYSENLPYSGLRCNLPNGKINNFYNYKSKDFNISIRHEPRVYQYREGISASGDLINISNRRDNKYGKYYVCPDYIVSITSPNWDEELLIVLDAKYKSSANVKSYDFDSLELKYLRNIYSVKENHSVGFSPIKLLLIMYAHGIDSSISNLHRRHRLGGDLPVYPQTLGQKIFPKAESISKLSKLFVSLSESHHEEVKHRVLINKDSKIIST